MAQRMDAMAVRDPCGPRGGRGDFLGGADGQWCVGIAARTYPRGGPGEVPGGAQCRQEAEGE